MNPEGDLLAKSTYTSVTLLGNGYWLVESDGKFGLLNNKGKQNVNPVYTSIRPVENGTKAAFHALGANGLEVFLNAKGKLMKSRKSITIKPFGILEYSE